MVSVDRDGLVIWISVQRGLFPAQIAMSLNEAATLRDLERRLRATRAGFAALPLDERADATVPAPVPLRA